MPETIIQQPLPYLLRGNQGRVLAANNFDVRVLRTNTLLKKDEWKQLDTAVLAIARQRLVVVDALRRRGLVHNLGNLGVLISEWERLGDFTAAEQSMAARTRGQHDTPEWDLVSVPVPLTFKDFDVDIRRLQASRNRGSNIDTTSAQLAARMVAEKLEDTVMNGSLVAVGGSVAYGFTNYPSRITGSLGDTWDAVGYDGTKILDDVLAMIADAATKNMYGPFTLMIPPGYDIILSEDFKAASDKTIRQRLMEVNQISEILVAGTLTAHNVLLVQMTSDVVDLAIAQDITTVEWDELGGFVTQFRVFAAMTPRMKSDKNGQCGIVHYTGS